MEFFIQEANDALEKSGSSFFELETGDNMFRIVSEFKWGYKFNYQNREEAKERKYPFFRTDDPEVAANKSKLNLIATMVVFDYKSGSLKSFNVHQKDILKGMKSYLDNPKYGDLTGYDIVIKKVGEGRESRYQVMANPPEEYSPEIIEALNEVEIVLDNAFEGESVIVRK